MSIINILMLIFNFLQIKNRFFFIIKLKKINMRKKIPKYFSYSKLEKLLYFD